MYVDKEYTARKYLGRLVKQLEETFGLATPGEKATLEEKKEYARIRRSLLAHIARVGPSNFEDLVAWVLLECLENNPRKADVSWKEVLRAADRVQHRINHRRSRERTILNANIAAQATVSPSSVIDLKNLLKNLSQTDFIIFHGLYLEGKKVNDIGEELGMSPSRVYDRISVVRQMIIKTLE